MIKCIFTVRFQEGLDHLFFERVAERLCACVGVCLCMCVCVCNAVSEGIQANMNFLVCAFHTRRAG